MDKAKFVRIGKKSFLNKNNILLVSDEINSRPIIDLREKLKESNRLIKMSAGKESKTFMLLDNGMMITLSINVEEIIKLINEDN